MKTLFTLTILLIGISCFGQERGAPLHPGKSLPTSSVTNSNLTSDQVPLQGSMVAAVVPYALVVKDTLTIYPGKGINFVRIGTYLYKITIPSPVFEEVKPVFQIDPHIFDAGMYTPTTIPN